MAKKKYPKSDKAKNKIKVVMHEFEEGELPIGTSKKKVKNRDQAIAIALNTARKEEKPPKRKK